MRKLLLGALVALTSLAGAGSAQDFPNHTLTMVIPFAAGGPTYLLGRVMAERMSQTLLAQFGRGAGFFAGSSFAGGPLKMGPPGPQINRETAAPRNSLPASATLHRNGRRTAAQPSSAG